jgi:zinc finger CCHC domain-containing protein 8
VLTPTKCSDSSDKPAQKLLIDINFRNKKTYFAFHEEFIELIKKYYKDKSDDLDICDDASNKRICISEKLVKKSDSFLIDTTPNVDNSKNSTESTPRYTSFSKVILSNIKDNEEDKLVTTNSANKCFNCDKGSHSLRQCPEPRNMLKIRKARNDFNRKELRYHDNDEYSDLIPGQLSDDLKSALGLTDNQLPLHVYKMRNYGYPNAWLEEAKVYYSGLEILTDKNVETSGNNIRDSFKYDIQRIYDFPGFNVLPSPPFIDKHRVYNLPPMQAHHSKEEFIMSLGDFVVNGYKKRKLRDTIEKFDTSTNVEDVEMDVDNDVSYNEITLNKSKGINHSNNSPEDGELSNNSDESLNCEELDEKRKKLLTELSEINDVPAQNGSSLVKDENNDKNAQQSEDIKQGHVETTIFGCPVLPSFSPFEILPSNVNFQQGVCDVIAFENLAQSTGKYENMKGIIKKVRVFVKEQQKE